MRQIVGLCGCGADLEFQESAGSGAHREIECTCGRRHDVELKSVGWSSVAQLTPERSVPISGFSRELRHAADAERFWFSYPLRGDVALPVHILFSPATKMAEVKAADLKVYHLEGVGLPTDARRQWIGWWQSTHRPHRSRGPSPMVPQRVGRLPAALTEKRPAPPASH